MTEIKTDIKINTCLIDAFTMTFRGCTPHDIIALLGLSELDWELDSGRYGYRKALKFGAITIMYDGIVPNMGVCLYLLGRGVEELTNLTQNRSIFYSLLTSTCYDARLTRIDIACDDYIGYLSMGTIRDKANSKEVRTRLTKKWQVNGLGGQDGHTIYFGVRQSECMIRFYDKRAEQHTNYHWIRAELVLRHTQAELFRRVVCQELDSASGELDKQVALLGRRVLADKAEFLERTKDSNISRWPVCRWWTDFLEGCVPIRLSEERKVPTLDKKIEWLLTQVAPSLVLVIGMVGVDFLDLIIQYGCEKLNRKNVKEMMQHMQAQGRTPVFDLERDMADIYWDITLSILDCYSYLYTADN